MTKRCLALVLTLCMAFTLLPMTALATGSTIYVATNGNDSTGDGSQDSPFASIGKGLSIAATTGGTVMVAAGNYSLTEHLVIPAGVTLQGDVNGTTFNTKLTVNAAIWQPTGIQESNRNRLITLMSGATIKDMEIDGSNMYRPFTGNPTGAVNGVFFFNTTASIDNIMIYNCTASCVFNMGSALTITDIIAQDSDYGDGWAAIQLDVSSAANSPAPTLTVNGDIDATIVAVEAAVEHQGFSFNDQGNAHDFIFTCCIDGNLNRLNIYSDLTNITNVFQSAVNMAYYEALTWQFYGASFGATIDQIYDTLYPLNTSEWQAMTPQDFAGFESFVNWCNDSRSRRNNVNANADCTVQELLTLLATGASART